MTWNVLPASAEILAVHAALLDSGHILLFTGNEHDPDQNENGQVDHCRLFDCVSGAVTALPGAPADLFCCGHAFLGDGRLMVCGGTKRFNQALPADHMHHIHFPGLRDAFAFSPQDLAWHRVASLNTGPLSTAPETVANPALTGGRWYPTLITLPSGQVIAFSGHPGESDARHNNNTPEIYPGSPDDFTWRRIDVAKDMTDYPRAHVLPDGRLLFTTPVDDAICSFDPDARTWSRVSNLPVDRNDQPPLPPGRHLGYGGFACSSVLLPLVEAEYFRPHILMTGDLEALRLDLGQAVPAWKKTGARGLPGMRRWNLNLTLLPTGQVAATGGINTQFTVDGHHWVGSTPDEHAVRAVELYDPATDTWSVGEEATVKRNYHSVALLMPDGRVFTAGSNLNAGRGPAARELRIEIYSPWYVNRPDRPRLTLAPDGARCGEKLVIETPDAAAIAKVTLVRAGSATHAFNPDQRCLQLLAQPVDATHLQITLPSAKIAIPGSWLLHLVNHDGVPSVGRFIRIGLPFELNIPPLVWQQFFGGVFSDGGGFAILGSGKIVKIPPRGPLVEMIAALGVFSQAEELRGAARIRAQLAALDGMRELVGRMEEAARR